jgi:uncharacterized protein (DUF1015 family)
MEIKPFKAMRFNESVVGNVANCIAPPYDVIGTAQQKQLYAKSKYNIVRITRGETSPSDNSEQNAYTRAAGYLAEWVREGALQEDAKEAIYGYVQDFELNGSAFQRLTFVALGKLEEFGKTVKPHEQVFAKPMLDRLNLKRATATRFGLVFMLYEDPQGVADRIIEKAMSQPPLIDFTDEQDVRHRLFSIVDDADIDAIAAMMADKSCIIADGHHRYTTGLTYSKESGNPAAQYQMLAFTNTRQRGLVVLATHRAAGGLVGFDPQNFLRDLTRAFTVSKFACGGDATSKEAAKQQMLATMKAAHEQDATSLGLYMADGNFYLAVLKDPSLMEAAASEKTHAWRTLDVSVLQKLILEGILHIDGERMGNPDYVEYVKDMPNAMDELIARVDAGQRQIAFFTNPVKMEQLTRITDAGERMPHKSTYFFPKMYTGLTIQKL